VRDWGLGESDVVLDPFVGAGTTLLACKEEGVGSIGFDLSPLAELSSRVKTSPPSAAALRNAWKAVGSRIEVRRRISDEAQFGDLVLRAFPGELLPTLHGARQAIRQADLDSITQDALLLALLGTLPTFSRLVRKGGWLEERQGSMPAELVRPELKKRVDVMIQDLEESPPSQAPATTQIADARSLPLAEASVSGVVTSPPYPNRHDYTRVFGVELEFAFLDWGQLRDLRYQSFSSHPEAKPDRPKTTGSFREPADLTRKIRNIGDLITDSRAKIRIPRMLHGYFQDMHLVLSEISRVLRPDSRAALVVGNVRYCGVPLYVDRFTIEAAGQAGLVFECAYAARYRGNSAQQMRDHGRHPQRESVLVFRTH